MPLKKNFPFYFILFSLVLHSSSMASAPSSRSNAQFTAVSGKVTVAHGKKQHKVHKDSIAVEGDVVSTGKGANATLRFFDGSELQIMGSSKFGIRKLVQSSSQDKTLQFKLNFGKLFAKVKKLLSSRSAFEIEAGGVVCGVRGTEYEVAYDPDKDKVDLFVKEGNVWAKAGGETFQYGAGGEGHFRHGNPDVKTGNPEKGNKGKDDKDKGDRDHRLETFKGNHPDEAPDAFRGFDGNREDPLRPLAGLADDLHRLNDKSGDDQLLGVGAHTVLIRLKYPEQ